MIFYYKIEALSHTIISILLIIMEDQNASQ